MPKNSVRIGDLWSTYTKKISEGVSRARRIIGSGYFLGGILTIVLICVNYAISSTANQITRVIGTTPTCKNQVCFLLFLQATVLQDILNLLKRLKPHKAFIKNFVTFKNKPSLTMFLQGRA